MIQIGAKMNEIQTKNKDINKTEKNCLFKTVE